MALAPDCAREKLPLFVIYLFILGFACTYVSVCHMHVRCPQKTVWDSLGLELWMVVSHPVGPILGI